MTIFYFSKLKIDIKMEKVKSKKKRLTEYRRTIEEINQLYYGYDLS